MREIGGKLALMEFSLACCAHNLGLGPNIKEQLNGPS